MSKTRRPESQNSRKEEQEAEKADRALAREWELENISRDTRGHNQQAYDQCVGGARCPCSACRGAWIREARRAVRARRRKSP